jgi:ABC-type phosphate transport system substrate-binding protein
MTIPPRLAITVACALAVASIAPASHAGGGYVVVCNASNPIASLSSVELKRAFTGGTRQWENGAVVQIGISSGDTPELSFVAGSMGMSSAELLTRVQQQVFRGELRRPVLVRSAAECVALARSNPGAICATAASGALPAGVKAISVK